MCARVQRSPHLSTHCHLLIRMGLVCEWCAHASLIALKSRRVLIKSWPPDADWDAAAARALTLPLSGAALKTFALVEFCFLIKTGKTRRYSTDAMFLTRRNESMSALGLLITTWRSALGFMKFFDRESEAKNNHQNPWCTSLDLIKKRLSKLSWSVKIHFYYEFSTAKL